MKTGDLVYAVVKGDDFRLTVSPATIRSMATTEIVLAEVKSYVSSSYTVWHFPASAVGTEIFKDKESAERAREEIEYAQSGRAK